MKVVKESNSKINIYYGKTYSHSLHSNKIIAEEIFKIVDGLVCGWFDCWMRYVFKYNLF